MSNRFDEFDRQYSNEASQEYRENPLPDLTACQREVLECVADENVKMTDAERTKMFLSILKQTEPVRFSRELSSEEKAKYEANLQKDLEELKKISQLKDLKVAK